MIRTFDNKQWQEADILQKMLDDDFYYGYLGKNALSSSSCKTLLKSPKTYYYTTKYGSAESQALRDGKLFHTMALEPHKVDDLHFVEVSSKNTKAYKLAKEQYGEVYTATERKDAERLTDNLLRNEQVTRLMNKAEFEVPAIKMIEDIPFRGKADILRNDVIIDLKTMSGGIDTFQYSASKYSYDLQAYLYKEMFGIDDFVFIVIDKGSLDIGIFECSQEFYARGEEKLHKAIDTYKDFFTGEGIDLDQYVLKGLL